MIINRVRPLSVGKIAGFLYALIGLFIGAIISVFAVFGGLATAGAGHGSEAEGPATAIGAAFGVAGLAAFVIVPLVYGFFGFLGAIIMAFVYNIVARIVGGIEVDVS
jgi:hypothetical protein